MLNEPLIELTGTITTVYPVEHDGRSGQFIQKLILDNAIAVQTVETIPMKLLIVIKVHDAESPIPFLVNHPITVKGFFRRLPQDFLSFVHRVHAPSGFIRYDGKVYR